MVKNHSGNLKISFPRWVVIFFSFCGIFTILFFTFYIIWVVYNGQLASRLFRCAIFFSVILGAFWVFFKILFYSVTATERGFTKASVAGPPSPKKSFGEPPPATIVIIPSVSIL